MFAFRSYVSREDAEVANKKLPKLMFEGLLLGGSGLGVLALIFEIAADAFSVAAYQTLLAIHGASGYHSIAVLAFIVLSALLFLGIVPAYKAGAYLRPNAGGSGPLVEAIGPPRMRWLSWVGTSLFFLDAVLTIIISSISAADVTMLIFPEWAQYRILLAEGFAFFIMAVLVAVGPKRAVPLFLLGGGAFTIFTLFALTIVGSAAAGNPQWAFLTDGIVQRLQETGVAEEVIRVAGNAPAIGSVLFFQFFFRSMSSAMLGFSGYEVIPASGKHAARPKWKVINTALTLAAIFLIGTGVVQLLTAEQWKIPATEGYSTLLIEYEIVAVQQFSDNQITEIPEVTAEDRADAAHFLEEHHHDDRSLEEVATDIAIARRIEEALGGTSAESLLLVAAFLLAVILLLAQGGGYVGGAAVAANAAQLGRLPSFFANDRIGIAVIWAFSAALIPIIREVVVVEAFYAFGFVSAFVITSTTVFFVRDDALLDRGIQPGSDEAKSLRFAGFRGMFASYFMLIVLVTQKTDALGFIVVSGVIITLFQVVYSRGGLTKRDEKVKGMALPPAVRDLAYESGVQRAHDEARQRGIADLVNDMIEHGELVKFNVDSERIRRLVAFLHSVEMHYFSHEDHGDEISHEPSVDLQETYDAAYNRRKEMKADIERYSHYGIFTFIDKYHANWVSPEHGRDHEEVKRAMITILFPMTDPDLIWEEFENYNWGKQPEEIWQFCRQRYQWAKDQWPNLSDRLTTVWTLQELGLIDKEIDVKTIVSINARNELREVQIHTHWEDDVDEESIKEDSNEVEADDAPPPNSDD